MLSEWETMRSVTCIYVLSSPSGGTYTYTFCCATGEILRVTPLFFTFCAMKSSLKAFLRREPKRYVMPEVGNLFNATLHFTYYSCAVEIIENSSVHPFEGSCATLKRRAMQAGGRSAWMQLSNLHCNAFLRALLATLIFAHWIPCTARRDFQEQL